MSMKLKVLSGEDNNRLDGSMKRHIDALATLLQNCCDGLEQAKLELKGVAGLSLDGLECNRNQNTSGQSSQRSSFHREASLPGEVPAATDAEALQAKGEKLETRQGSKDSCWKRQLSGNVSNDSAEELALEAQFGNVSEHLEQPTLKNTNVQRPKKMSVVSVHSVASMQSVVPAALEDYDDDGDKVHFEVAEAWDMHRNTEEAGRRGTSAGRGSIPMDSEEGIGFVKHSEVDFIKPWFIIHPNSAYKGIWDVLGVLFLLFDMIVIPLSLVDLPESETLQAMAWIIRMFWTLDFFISFACGFVEPSGTIQLQPVHIIRHYASTWMLLDLAVLIVDWVSLDSAARVGRAARGVRAMRMVRLLRIFRILGEGSSRILEYVSEHFRDEVQLLVEILQTIFCIVLVAHFIACAWYAVGIDAHESSKPSWVDAAGLSDASLPDRYIASMHWALSQYQGGMDELRPHNQQERIFAVCVMTLIYISATFIVSRLTSSMTQLQMLSSTHKQNMADLKFYLLQNRISRNLISRIHHTLKHRDWVARRQMGPESVTLLNFISEPLLEELFFEIYSKVLSCHMFFSDYSSVYPQVMMKVCHQSIQSMFFSPGDAIFNAGEVSEVPCMYIVHRGLLEYVTIAGKTYTLEKRDAMLFDEKIHIISEATLWIKSWVHLGMFSAAEHSQVLSLNATKFQAIVSRVQHPTFDPRVYAQAFVEKINELGSARTDLPVEIDASVLRRTEKRTMH